MAEGTSPWCKDSKYGLERGPRHLALGPRLSASALGCLLVASSSPLRLIHGARVLRSPVWIGKGRGLAQLPLPGCRCELVFIEFTYWPGASRWICIAQSPALQNTTQACPWFRLSTTLGPKSQERTKRQGKNGHWNEKLHEWSSEGRRPETDRKHLVYLWRTLSRSPPVT